MPALHPHHPETSGAIGLHLYLLADLSKQRRYHGDKPDNSRQHHQRINITTTQDFIFHHHSLPTSGSIGNVILSSFRPVRQ
jgi:hypothetical protein